MNEKHTESIPLKNVILNSTIYTSDQIDEKFGKCLQFDDNNNVDARSQKTDNRPLYGTAGGNIAEGINTGIGSLGFSIISGDIANHTLHIYESFQDHPEITAYIGKPICFRIAANFNKYSTVTAVLTAENKLSVDVWPSIDNEQTYMFGGHERFIQNDDGTYTQNKDGNVLMYKHDPSKQPDDESIIRYKWLFCPDEPNIGVNITLNALANHVEGQENHCFTAFSHSEGRENQSYGQYSHTEGRKTEAGYAAHASGYQVSARGDQSFAHGKNAFASHNGSFVWSISNNVYMSHGNNTFNINPTNGICGFYIQDKSLSTILGDMQSGLISRIEFLEGMLEKSYTGNIFVLANGGKEYEEIDLGTIDYQCKQELKNTLVKIQKISPNIGNLKANAFSGFKVMTDANLVGVTEFGDHSFGYCDKLSNVVLDKRLTHTGTNVFRGSPKLSSVTIPDGCLSIDNGYLRQTGLTGITIPESVTHIDRYAFAQLQKLSSITIPGSVTILSDRVFENSTGLKEITFKAGSNLSVGTACFQQTNLTTMIVEENHPSLSSYENKILIEKASMKILHILDEEETVIPEGVKTFGSSVCFGQSKRKRVVLPSTLSSNVAQFFENPNLTSYTVSEQNTVLKHSDDHSCILSKDGTKLFRANSAITTTPSSCTSIEQGAFSHLNCPSKSITISNNIQLIRNGAFNGGQGTELVVLDNPNTTIDINAFNNTSPKLVIKFKNLDLTDVQGNDDATKAKTFITSKTHYDRWKNNAELKIQWESVNGSSGEFVYKS